MSSLSIEPITATRPSRTVLPTWRETGAATMPQRTQAPVRAEESVASPQAAAPTAATTAAPVATAAASNADPAQVAQAISSNSLAQRASVRSSSSLVDLYTFQNKYLYGTSSNTWAKIDTDQDGVWGRTELETYAQDYHNATGRTLDVDDLILRYGDTGDLNGVIKYQGQLQAYQDDALGISYVQDAILLAESQGNSGLRPGGSQGTVNPSALQDFVNDFTYGTANKLYAKIDKDQDGLWSLEEMREYGKAYEKATGVKLDIDALFAKYDTDGSGFLKYQEQNAMYKDDALGLSRISDLMKQQESGKMTDTGSGLPDKLKDTSLSDRIREAMNSLSGSQKYNLARTFGQSLQQAAMLDYFTMVNMGISTRNSLGHGLNYGINSYWNMSNLAMTSMFV